ncbi:MAG: glutathione S-transferase family protein [Azospirillum sp.]|nr:glutathione S-transferase family protein [Azospirillum sp.]
MTIVTDPDYTLHGTYLSQPTARVALFLSMAGLPFRYKHHVLKDGTHRTPDFKALNPLGQVPALCHGDLALGESTAILVYLAETTGQFGPATPAERWRITEWLAWVNDGLSVLQRCRAARRFGWDEPIRLWWDARAPGPMAILETALNRSGFLAGDRPTIADIAVFPMIDLIDESGLTLDGYPAIAAWYQRMLALPGCRHQYDLLPKGDVG